MKKRIEILLLALGGLAIALCLLLWLMPAPRTLTEQQLKAEYTRAAQRLYRHEILSLYRPPEEAFTPHGLQLLRRIQELNSAVFLPYLVMGSVPVQPDVLYNPWFDLFILVEDSDGEINSVGLASSLAAGQSPQLQVQEKFWQELYRRYPVAQMATFAHPKTFENTSRVILEMRNLTNRFGWLNCAFQGSPGWCSQMSLGGRRWPSGRPGSAGRVPARTSPAPAVEAIGLRPGRKPVPRC